MAVKVVKRKLLYFNVKGSELFAWFSNEKNDGEQRLSNDGTVGVFPSVAFGDVLFIRKNTR